MHVGMHTHTHSRLTTCTHAYIHLRQVVQQEGAATEEELEALLNHFHGKFVHTPISEPEVMYTCAYIYRRMRLYR